MKKHRAIFVLLVLIVIIVIWPNIYHHDDRMLNFIFFGGPGSIMSVIMGVFTFKYAKDIVKLLGFIILGTLLYVVVFWLCVYTGLIGVIIFPGIGAWLFMIMLKLIMKYPLQDFAQFGSFFLGLASYGLAMFIQEFITVSVVVIEIISIWWILFALLIWINDHQINRIETKAL